MQVSAEPINAGCPHRTKPIALIVLLENIGHVAGVKLPQFVMFAVDYLTEEYAKALLRYYGAYKQYDCVIILEDELAAGAYLSDAILRLSPAYSIDLLLLVHGKEGQLVGYRGEEMIGADTFALLQAEREKRRSNIDLRMVFGLNCYGASLVRSWRSLGAIVVNGSPGVNWLPEPSLTVFLRNWLRGESYSLAVQRSNSHARRWGGRIWRSSRPNREHSMVESSRQVIYGARDVTIHSRDQTNSA